MENQEDLKLDSVDTTPSKMMTIEFTPEQSKIVIKCAEIIKEFCDTIESLEKENIDVDDNLNSEERQAVEVLARLYEWY